MVRVPVIKAFAHEGRAYQAGDTIDVAPVVAAALHHRGVVSLTRDVRAQQSADPPKKSPSRRYRRRDLQAED